MAEVEIEPAVEGVDWRHFPTWTGKMRVFCMLCDPSCDKYGYCDIGTLNRHLRDKHNKRAVNSTSKRQGGRASAPGVQTRSKRAPGDTDGSIRTRVRKSKERQGAAKGPSGEPRKRPAPDATTFEAAKRRGVNRGPSRKNNFSGAAEEVLDVINDGTRGNRVPDLTNTQAHRHPHRHIVLPVCGLDSVTFKSEATANNTSQTFEARWFQMSAHCEAAKCRADECNVHYVKFPICCNNPMDKVVQNITMSPSLSGPCNGAYRKPSGTVDIEGDFVQSSPRQKKTDNKGEGREPLVNYSNESDGPD